MLCRNKSQTTFVRHGVLMPNCRLSPGASSRLRTPGGSPFSMTQIRGGRVGISRSHACGRSRRKTQLHRCDRLRVWRIRCGARAGSAQACGESSVDTRCDDHRHVRAAVYDRASLAHGHVIKGPAIIGEYSSTTLVPAGFRCVVDAYLNLVLEK